MSGRNSDSGQRNLYNFVVGNKEENIETAVAHLLLALGFKSKLTGTSYLKEAIITMYRNAPESRVSLSNVVYPAIACKSNSNANSVERNIRNSIQDCYNNGSIFNLNDISGYDIISADYPPTNYEFISSVVSWLHLEMDGSA